MKTTREFPVILGAATWVLATVWAGPGPPSEMAGAIQAIEQAADPSAAVAAYANGMAVDRNDPRVHDAYVRRMVELGLPELAYHQAQMLTTLQSGNGLAWGVVAYVNARRGEMPEAISAINLAGQGAPNNPFVQRTAGEILAWYDIKADKSKLPDNAKDGLSKVRSALEKQPDFSEAYKTAKDAYRAQATAAQAPAQGGASGSAPIPQAQRQADQVAPAEYGPAAPPAPAYPPQYYYDSGPGWVQPAPWWWWQPVGFFSGANFFPFSTVLVFNHRHFFHHHHFFPHDRVFFHDRFFFHHDGFRVAFNGGNGFFFRNGKTTFFGGFARPNAGLATSLRANFDAAPGFVSTGPGMHGPMGGSFMDSGGTRSAMASTMQPRSSAFASSGMGMRQGTVGSVRGGLMFAPSMPARMGVMPSNRFGMMPPTGRPWAMMPRRAMPMPGRRGGMPGQGFRGVGFAAPLMAPHAMPVSRGFAGGGFRGGMVVGGGFRGGAMRR